MPSFKTNKRELLIIVLLLIVAIAVWGAYTLIYRTNEPEGICAEIVYDGVVLEKVYLEKDRVFSVKNLPNITYEVKDHKIAFIQSDCPDQVCIQTGWLDAGGHFAACLPNKVLLWIVENESQSMGAVAQ